MSLTDDYDLSTGITVTHYLGIAGKNAFLLPRKYARAPIIEQKPHLSFDLVDVLSPGSARATRFEYKFALRNLGWGFVRISVGVRICH
jgi:hypothetical protein